MNDCLFCAIARKEIRASIVMENDIAMAFMDTRQFHDGHVLVIPKSHYHDIRDIDATVGAAIMQMAIAVSRSVSTVFSVQGMNLWHSVDKAGNQEIPHMHLHIHPRTLNDSMLVVYPSRPNTPDRETLDALAESIRNEIQRTAAANGSKK